jgi:LysR family transcriptional regulator for metE and metH
MDVDIRDLELLEALGEHATLTAAARHLYVSQPALSQRLLRLEERLATPLFERRGRQLVANAAGRRMLQAAQTTLRELRAARLDLHELADGRRRPLRLASQCSTNYEWITDVVRPLHQRLPRTELRIEPLTTRLPPSSTTGSTSPSSPSSTTTSTGCGWSACSTTSCEPW